MKRSNLFSDRLPPARQAWLHRLSVMLATVCLVSGAAAQQPAPFDPSQQIRMNFKDAEIGQVVDYMATITGKTFIVDPRVRAQISVLSSSPMSVGAAYEVFQSALQVHSFAAIEQGNVIKIVPDANIRQMPANDLPNSISGTSDEMVTQVIPVRNANAGQLVPILRPLGPQYAQLAAYTPGNLLIISDRAANVKRMMRIIERIDQTGDDSIDIVRLENASATEIARVLASLNSGGGQGAEGGVAPKVVADERSNSLLLSGEKSQRLRLKALIAHLDTPLESGGDTEVRYLRYADAEDIAKKISSQAQGLAQAANGPGAGGASASQANRDVMVWADKQTNALVVTAPPKIKKQIMSIVDKLDIRRLQVQVEAILVEISAEKTSELGINWAAYNNDPNNTSIPGAMFNQPVGGLSILDAAKATQNPGGLSNDVTAGLTLGVGRLVNSGTNFALLLRALRGDANTNIISTPSIVTMDNEEAEVKIAQEVPFLTGQYANTGAGTGGTANSVSPFQTIQREEVGTILKITPQINGGDAMVLKISQEQSGLAQGTSNAVDLITNKRTISTKVLVEDGNIIVLGGLIEDNLREGQNRVPILGAIPIIGELFKTRNASKRKTNLMVFIRPTILRDGAQASIETNAKYNVSRNMQLDRNKGKVTLLPGERQPTLPPILDLTKYGDPTAGAKPPEAGTDATRGGAEKPQPLPDPPK